MTTRSGVIYKPMEEPGTHAASTLAEGQTTTGGTLPEIASLTEMVRVMIQDRESREKEIAEERVRREQRTVISKIANRDITFVYIFRSFFLTH